VRTHDLVLTEWSRTYDIERQSTDRIGRYRRKIDQHTNNKPAYLDEDSCDERLSYDFLRFSFVSCLPEREYFSDNGEQDEKSESEISEVLHDIPECPEWRIHVDK